MGLLVVFHPFQESTQVHMFSDEKWGCKDNGQKAKHQVQRRLHHVPGRLAY